jgi:hypothetical protein
MAELPFPQIQPVMAEEPTGRVDPSIFKTRPREGIASGIQAIAEGIGAVANRVSHESEKEDFSADIQRKEDGSLEIIQPSSGHFIFGGEEAAAGTFHANHVGTLAAMQTIIDKHAVEVRGQFEGKPKDYAKSMAQYADQWREQHPGKLGDVGWAEITKTANQHYVNMVETQRQNGLVADYNDTITRLKSSTSNFLNIARGSNATDPAVLEKSDQWKEVESYYRSLSANPKYSKEWTPVKVDDQLASLKDAARYEWVLGNVQRIRDTPGQGIPGATKWMEDNLNPAKIKTMGPEEIDKLRVAGVSKIQQLTEKQAIDRKLSLEETNRLGTNIRNGTLTLDDAQYRSVIEGARSKFNYEGAQELDNIRRAAAITRPFTSLNPTSALTSTGMLPAQAHVAPPRIEPSARIADVEKQLKLSQQERSLYSRHLENMTGAGGVNNPNGSRSTVSAIYANLNGKAYVLPTVYDGKKLSENDAIAKAKKVGLDKFPSYANEKEADARYRKMYSFMEKDAESYGYSAATKYAADGTKIDVGGAASKPSYSGGGSRVFDAASTDHYLDVTHGIENPTGNPRAVSSTGARGDFQFIKSTWAKYGQGLDIDNPTHNREAARRLAIDNANDLKAKIGRAPTEGEVYLAHQQGSAGAAALLSHPEMNAVQALNQYAGVSLSRADQAIRVNGGNPSMTAGQFAQKWITRFENGKSAPQVASHHVTGPNSNVPYTPQQLHDHPELLGMLPGLYAANRRETVSYARDQMSSMGRGIEMGAIPSQGQLAEVFQIGAANPELAKDVESLKSKFDAAPLGVRAAGMPDGGAGLLAAAEEQARSSGDIHLMNTVVEARKQAAERVKSAKEDWHEYGARSGVGWTDKKPIPFAALADPRAASVEVQQEIMSRAVDERRKSAIAAAPHLGVTPAEAMFTGGDVKSLSSMLKQSDGNGASILLRSLERTLAPEEMSALAANNEFAKTIGGLTRSGDPAKVGAAMGFLDKQATENFEAFKKNYGDDMPTKFAVWDGMISHMAPDIAAKKLNAWTDPAAEKARRDGVELAKEKLKLETGQTVANKLGSNWFLSENEPLADPSNMQASSLAMLREYKEIYSDIYAAGGDSKIADEGAVKQLKEKWGPSKIMGGRIMSYPPDALDEKGNPKYYPLSYIGKSHDYLKEQLKQDVYDIAKKHYPEYSPEKLADGEHILVADKDTQRNIANKVPPSYAIVVKDKDGMLIPLMDRSVNPPVAKRFFGDVSLANKAATWEAQGERLRGRLPEGEM